jgi:hypothetical protein
LAQARLVDLENGQPESEAALRRGEGGRLSQALPVASGTNRSLAGSSPTAQIVARSMQDASRSAKSDPATNPALHIAKMVPITLGRRRHSLCRGAGVCVAGVCQTA